MKDKVIFLRDPHYMSKNIKCAGESQSFRKIIFLDHDHQEILGVIHAFPVPASSVKIFIDRYKKVWSNQVEFRFKQVSPPTGWKIYALNWDDTNLYVQKSSSKSPQPIKFSSEIHINQECMEYHRMFCGCCVHEEWGIPLRYQVVFSPISIAYISSK